MKLYNWDIKQLLGVRMTTCNELCYLELGLPPLRALVISRQRKFFRNMWRERQEMDDDPWSYTVRLVMESTTPTGRFISDLIDQEMDDVGEALCTLLKNICGSIQFL